MIFQTSGKSLGAQKSIIFPSGEAVGVNIICISDSDKAMVLLAIKTTSICKSI